MYKIICNVIVGICSISLVGLLVAAWMFCHWGFGLGMTVYVGALSYIVFGDS